MNWWNAFADRIEHDAPLAPMTCFRLGGRARYLFRPRDAQQLASLLGRARQEDVPVKLLGRGANVLVCDDGFEGVVVRLDQPAFRRRRRFGADLEVGGGADLMSLSRVCSHEGLSGLERLAGIPATVGGAVRMNAGGREGQFGDVVKEIHLLNPDGIEETWSRDQAGFGYRCTNLGDRIVLSVRLGLIQDEPARVRRAYAETVRRKAKSQPLSEKSAGCVFKNPRGQCAGALIDQAGLKGAAVGQVRVSRRHANFIIVNRGATASDVLRLIDLIRSKVRAMFGVHLETEIDIW